MSVVRPFKGHLLFPPNLSGLYSLINTKMAPVRAYLGKMS